MITAPRKNTNDIVKIIKSCDKNSIIISEKIKFY